MKRAFLFFIVLYVLAAGGMAAATGLPPFYSNIQTNEGSFFAVRPFYSHTTVEEGEIKDYLWPVYSRKSFKDEETSRALIFWFTHRFDASEESPRQRRWLLPFYFQGRDANDENYFALFPLGGTIHDFLGRDRLSFVLFPIYGTGQINDVKTTNVLWPIVSSTRGGGVRRDRIFPLYGKSELEGKYEKEFILWPFWTSAKYFYPGDSGNVWILFPLVGRAEMEKEQTLWLIPPFFRFTRGEEQNRTFCPWPFIQKVNGKKQDKFYIWPLWGTKHYKESGNSTSFMLWPLFWSKKDEQAHVEKTYRMALPFFFSERSVLREENVPEEEQSVVSNYWKIWPLMSWQREGETSRFRLLDLWPLKNSAPIERNWAPLWTLYKRTSEQGTVRKDLLWFVWHSEHEVETPDKETGDKEWSLLKGLLSYKKEAGKRQVRLLYFIHFGK
jgi:hypothetical protein